MLTFGLFISKELKLSGYTQEKIAELLTRETFKQIDQGYVSRRLQDGKWTVNELMALSDLLGSEDIYIYAVGRQVVPVLQRRKGA